METDREAALAAAPALQPDFSSKSVTKQQLAQLQVLHHKRLELKIKQNKISSQKKGSQSQRKADDNKATNVSYNKDHVKEIEWSGLPDRSSKEVEKKNLPSKKRQKLHWGLDTKERWERKGNM